MKIPFAVAGGAVAIAAVAALSRHGAPPAASALHPVTPSWSATALSTPHAARLLVYVAGEVHRPGVYGVPPGARVQAALRAADGTTANADLLAINLAQPLSDGEKVLVPPKGAVPLQDALAGAGSSQDAAGMATARSRRRHGVAGNAARGRHHRGAHKVPPAQPIDLNAADEAQLEQLPGIGPSLAARIVTYREVNGPYRAAAELLDVAGMTDRRLSDIDPYIIVR